MEDATLPHQQHQHLDEFPRPPFAAGAEYSASHLGTSVLRRMKLMGFRGLMCIRPTASRTPNRDTPMIFPNRRVQKNLPVYVWFRAGPFLR